MKKKFAVIFFLCLAFSQIHSAQEVDYPDEVEIFLIDSYVTPELPYKFVLTYFTSDSVSSKVIIDEKYEHQVSMNLTEDHKAEINFIDYSFDSAYVPFTVYLFNENGKEIKKEEFDVILPYNTEITIKNDPGLLIICLGGIVFSSPSPTFISMNGDSYLSLVKEVPILTFFSGGYNYPSSYVSLEYAHVFDAPIKNFLRLGYKKIFQLPVIEYVSPGVNLFTNFLGLNGISPEISIGWFKFYNVFTVYSKYRYNFKLGGTNNDFNEITIGLYSNFFSINL